MKVIGIDGACRNNGKPDCVSTYGVFAVSFEGTTETFFDTFSGFEKASTNQRGEMRGLVRALEHILGSRDAEALIITDSEYLFNSMTKNWITNWENKGWITASGTPVKNKDLWEQIKELSDLCEKHNISVSYYHIKGHLMPVGKVTATWSLFKDPSAAALYKYVQDKYETEKTSRDIPGHANELFNRNNGFVPDSAVLKRFVCFNIVADLIATNALNTADDFDEPEDIDCY